jgi:hypothetical protein
MSLLSELAREAGEAQPVGNADRLTLRVVKI